MFEINFLDIISVSIVLFAVIDILGSIPIIIDLREKNGKIESLKATLVAGGIMILFLFTGKSLLSLFGIDIPSFAIAGSFIIFVIAIEMILGVTLFKGESGDSTASIVPIAFPLIAGAGSLTSILSLKAEFATINIFIGIIINLMFIYLVLKITPWIAKKIGPGGINILRRFFGIILLAIAIKLFRTNVGI